MKPSISGIQAAAVVAMCVISLCGVKLLASSEATAQATYVVDPIVEKKVKQLPTGPLFWRIENFPTLAEAQAAAGVERWNPDTIRYEVSTSLAAEIANKVWLFTLGATGGSTPGGTKVIEIGPVPTITAPEYLLRVNHGHGPPGAKTPVHSHPGAESFYVVAGRLGQRTPHNVRHVEAGNSLKGHPAGMAMEVFNSGTTDLTALIMFVVDASKPFSVPAKLE